MQIIVDYKEEKDSCNYYNHVLEAIETCVKSIEIETVVFKDFPLSEAGILMFLIKQSTKTGTIIFNNRLIFERSEDALKISIPDNIKFDNSRCVFAIQESTK